MQRKLATVLAMAALSAVSLMIGMMAGPVVAPARPLGDQPAVGMTGVPEVVRARRFELVDDAGNRRASMHLSGSGEPLFFLYDRAGQARVSLSIIDGQPGIDLGDSAGNSRLSLWVDGDTTEFQMVDKTQRPKVMFATDSANGGMLEIRDVRGNTTAIVPAPVKPETIARPPK